MIILAPLRVTARTAPNEGRAESNSLISRCGWRIELMNTRMQALTQVAPTPFFTPVTRGVLQRKCACGNHTVAGGECVECAKKKTNLQRKLTIGASNDPLEREADQVADQVV